MHNLATNFKKIIGICKTVLKEELMEDGNFIRYRNQPKMSDIAVIALSITAEVLGIDSENHLFSKIRKEYPHAFGPLMDRSNYNRRKRSLQQYIPWVSERISQHIDVRQDGFILDSIPIPVCSIVRAHSCRICKEDEVLPAKSYHASHKLYYYGFKMQMVVSKSGIPVTMGLTAANVHDVNFLSQLNDGRFSNCELIADKGYLSQPYQASLFEDNNIKLITPFRANMKNQASDWTPTYRVKRKRIETMFSQLCDQFMLKRNYAKSLSGLFSRLCAKMSGVAILQFINFKNNRPLNHLKHALAI